jgi:hypothetical protein
MRLAAKWKGLVGLGVATAALSFAAPVLSADHRDAPATSADAASDINDVYAFNDGTNVVLAMTVSPLAAAGAKFSDKTQYVFHTSSGSAFGTTSANSDVICTFTTDQKISCWVGTDDYVTGDASATGGITSTSGKTKVFAGMRADPFYFNLCGFREAVGEVDAAEGPPSTLPAPDAAGCPVFAGGATDPVVVALQTSLKRTGPTADPGASSDPVTAFCKGARNGTNPDDFATFNTLAIVVSVDSSLVTKGGKIMSVWGATYAAP